MTDLESAIAKLEVGPNDVILAWEGLPSELFENGVYGENPNTILFVPMLPGRSLTDSFQTIDKERAKEMLEALLK
jgi:hypothetical protein